MSDKARIHSALNRGNQLEFYDVVTQERTFLPVSLFYEDDFLGGGKGGAAFATSLTQGQDWIKKLVDSSGTPAVAAIANAGGGAVRLSLDATSEKQEATFYWGDVKQVDLTKGLVYEARVKLSTLPTSTVQAVFGVADSWIDGPDNNAHYLEFGATGNGAILCRGQDGTTQSANAASNALTVLATDWHVFRIDCNDVTDIRFFADGVDVTPSTKVPFAATGASAILQPYFSVYKASGTGVGSMDVDYVRLFANRA